MSLITQIWHTFSITGTDNMFIKQVESVGRFAGVAKVQPVLMDVNNTETDKSLDVFIFAFFHARVLMICTRLRDASAKTF